MKKVLLVFVAAIALVAASFWANSLTKSAERTAVVSDSPAMQLKLKYGKDKPNKGIIGAKEWLYQIRANQHTGIVSIADVINARDQWLAAKQLKADGGRSLGLTWEEMGPDNVGGRVRAILIDPANPNKMWTGGVSGGLFVSEDGGLNWNIHPWTLENDHVGVTVLRMGPGGEIFIGTGEGFAPVLDGVPNTFGAPGFIGSGVYRSTDNGETFQLIPATAPAVNDGDDRWAFIYEIAVDAFDANKFYVSTHKGLVMTTDGGNTFTTPNGIPAPSQNNPSVDVVTDPVLGHVYAVLGNRVFRSTDGGLNFVDFTGQNGFPIQSRIGRVEFSTTKSQENLVYACVATPGFGGILDGIYRSDDGGANWTTVVVGSENGFNPLGGQSFWNIAFGVDPNNVNRLILGGQLELWSVNVSGGRDLIGYWQPEIPSNPYYIHADMHVVCFHPTDPNILFIGTDGGVSKSTTAQDQFPKFTPRNKGLAITQFYGFSASNNGYILGGTQDNGTNLNDCRNNSAKSFREVNGGDGGDGLISRLNPNISFATLYSGELLRSVNNHDSYGCALDINIDANSDCQPDNGTIFISPFTLWEFDTLVETTIYKKSTRFNRVTQTVVSVDVTPELQEVRLEKSILFLCTNGGLWFSPNSLIPSNSPTWFNVPIQGTATAVSASEQGVAFVGTQNGLLYRIDGLADGYALDSLIAGITTTVDPNDPNIDIIDTTFDYFYKSPLDRDTWSFPGQNVPFGTHQGIRRVNIQLNAGSRYVTGIAINPKNGNQVAVTLGNYGNSNYVYQALNANDPPVGQTTPTAQFSSIQSNLPLMPVYDAVYDYYNGNNLILGTELGVWSTNNALDGSTNVSWATENSQSFGAVPTFQVRVDQLYEKDCRILYAGTHGRGVFRSTSLTPIDCDVNACKDLTSVNDLATNKTASLKVYPNPVTEAATVELFVVNGREAVVRVFDITGRMVVDQKVNALHSGLNKISLKLGHLQSGTYIIAAQISGEKAITSKLVKQ